MTEIKEGYRTWLRQELTEFLSSEPLTLDQFLNEIDLNWKWFYTPPFVYYSRATGGGIVKSSLLEDKNFEIILKLDNALVVAFRNKLYKIKEIKDIYAVVLPHRYIMKEIYGFEGAEGEYYEAYTWSDSLEEAMMKLSQI